MKIGDTSYVDERREYFAASLHCDCAPKPKHIPALRNALCLADHHWVLAPIIQQGPFYKPATLGHLPESSDGVRHPAYSSKFRTRLQSSRCRRTVDLTNVRTRQPPRTTMQKPTMLAAAAVGLGTIAGRHGKHGRSLATLTFPDGRLVRNLRWPLFEHAQRRCSPGHIRSMF